MSGLTYYYYWIHYKPINESQAKAAYRDQKIKLWKTDKKLTNETHSNRHAEKGIF